MFCQEKVTKVTCKHVKKLTEIHIQKNNNNNKAHSEDRSLSYFTI